MVFFFRLSSVFPPLSFVLVYIVIPTKASLRSSAGLLSAAGISLKIPAWIIKVLFVLMVTPPPPPQQNGGAKVLGADGVFRPAGGGG